MTRSEYSKLSPEILRFLADLLTIFIMSKFSDEILQHELTLIRADLTRRQTLQNINKPIT